MLGLSKDFINVETYWKMLNKAPYEKICETKKYESPALLELRKLTEKESGRKEPSP
jgi:hypothetical protein